MSELYPPRITPTQAAKLDRGEGGEAVKERRGAGRAPDRFGGRSADSASADGSVPIETGIGEAAAAAVNERRDAREVAVAPGQIRGDAR